MAERQQPRQVQDSKQQNIFKNVQLLKNHTFGTGSYGAVCKAKCDQLICAAKLLYPVLFQMKALDLGKECRQPFQRFKEKCYFLSCINHPNIVQYLGTYCDPETNAPVLLMELMDESLTHFLESSPGDIPYQIQVNLCYDIAQALAFLHVNGIIHGDLSSNNVLLIAGNRAKITDFGMSKFIDLNMTQLATMTTCPGTPAFMSPEALDEPPVYTEKLDNFSFGVLVIQIVTRQFPEPTDRFELKKLFDARNQAVCARVEVPEVYRRQAHISLIEPTHPLLPIALDCLQDRDVERPSSKQLCQTLDALKGSTRYEEHSQQDMGHLPIDKDRKIRTKNKQSKELQHEAKELRRMLARNEKQAQDSLTQFQVIFQKEKHEQQGTESPPTYEVPVTMVWDSLPDAPVVRMKAGSSAVIGDKAYFKVSGDSTVYEFGNYQWLALPKHPITAGFTIVNIDNILTTVGGRPDEVSSNKLYSYINNQWVVRFPPMQTKQTTPAAVYANDTLVVVGGSYYGACHFIVEILNTRTKQWSSVSSLPLTVNQPSAAICGDCVYIHPTYCSGVGQYSVFKCSLRQLTQSKTSSSWEEIVSLPVRCSSLVAISGHLLAVGGWDSHNNQFTEDIYQYSSTSNSWTIVSQMPTARSDCLTAFLNDNQLMVVGGHSRTIGTKVEVATIYVFI